ncbi:hypothetical protein [Lachnoclostridium sp. Marseille-P6806]|uniref:hypothetical protein n=1 Tax=Lachnoclostridium sp. Marseille-P6806 TaxID=2364793 RepID=UPI0013EF3904|nr:hypothetical protein [Lachnoclostridium sp. Marseille-P6806]
MLYFPRKELVISNIRETRSELLRDFLAAAGFEDIRIDRNRKGWSCVQGRRARRERIKTRGGNNAAAAYQGRGKSNATAAGRTLCRRSCVPGRC